MEISQVKKAQTYYAQTRREMIPFIPEKARTVLEVGVGSGNFASALKNEREVEVWGIEPVAEAAAQAAKKIEKVFIGKVEDVIHDLPQEYFDVVVFNDVLEHLIDPFNVLKQVKKLLHPKGVVVASIPNVRYWDNLKEFIKEKDWKYKEKGILDFTHLRFFTRKSMQRMFEETGYDLLKIQGINPTKSKNFRIINLFLFNQLEDAKFLQYVCVAQKKSMV